MNSHGIYVWGSLLICAVAILIEWQVLRQTRKRALQRVQRLQRQRTGEGL